MRENGLSLKDWVKFVDVAGRIFDPTMEMSVMQGPMALLEAISDGENGGDKLLKGGLSVGLNYVGQYYPTISGQAARTVDPVRRNTSSTAESPTGRALEKWKNKQIAKTPFLSKTLEPYVNVWGEEQKTTDNAILRAAYEFGSPAYVNKIKADEVDKEIIRLNKAAASDDDKIIPSKYFSNAVSFDGGKVSLDAKDLTMYNKIKGKASKEAIRKLSLQDEIEFMDRQGIVHSITQQSQLDEAPSAYKDIDIVMQNQADLVKPIETLYPIGVVKG
jgi:tRNA-splicing ligase RtcB